MKTLFAHNEKFSILWSLLLAAGLALSACSDDETAGGSSEDENTVAIENMTIMGVSQKGPFVRGSTVTANELLDGKTLKQTGNTFAGSIRSNDGLFDIKSVKLASQYAYMVVNGFYRNEVTGEESSAPITLQALTDLTLRSEANINLLTHLEYNRVVNLVTLGGLSVRKAKAQAESEVMKAFYINLSLENNFEDLNIFSAGDANAALLAISIMMQGDLAEAKFSTRLADFSLDLEADGEWNDEKAKAAIADWASTADYAQIRSNIEGWDLSDEVPPFEKYLNNFWWQNFGLGDCSKKNQSEIKQNADELSAYYGAHYICDANSWRIATDLEKDTYQWEAGKYGELRVGNVTGKSYVYMKRLESWGEFSYNSFWSQLVATELQYRILTPDITSCIRKYDLEQCFILETTLWYGFDADEKYSGTVSTISSAEKTTDGKWNLVSEDKNWDINLSLYTTGISGEAPGIVGIGFDWKQDGSPINITEMGGFCISYEWSSADELQLELGWNSAIYGDDTWFFPLHRGSNSLNIAWDSFMQEGWDCDHSTTPSTATDNSVGLRIRIKNGTTMRMGGTLIIKEIGSLGSCSFN